MHVAGIVFDLDGTLVDSRLDIAAAANHALVASGRRALSVDEVASYVGDGARPLLARAARIDAGSPELPDLLRVFLDYYAAHATTHSVLLPHARAALDELGASYPLALLTNKPRQTTDPVLAGLDLARHFRAAVAGDDLPEKKPDPAPLRAIAATLGVLASELVLVGDGPQDIECGRAAGARTVGVRGGLLPESRLLAARPDALLEHLGELPPLIRAWAQATSR